MFALFFVANLISNFDEDDVFIAAIMSVVWPVSIVAWIVYQWYRWLYELASGIKNYARRKKGDSE